MQTKAQRRRRSLFFVGRLLVVYLALLGLIHAFPTFVPRCAAVMIPTFVRVLDSDYEAGAIEISDESIVMDMASRKFEQFTTVQGTPGPAFSYNPRIQAEVLNPYPIIVFTLLLAWPMALRLRLISLCFAVVLVPLVCGLDLAAVALWWGSEWLSDAWLQIRNTIPATPENLSQLAAMGEYQKKMDWIDWAVSTCRPFFALLTAGLSAGPGILVLRTRRSPSETEAEA